MNDKLCYRFSLLIVFGIFFLELVLGFVFIFSYDSVFRDLLKFIV